MRTANRLLLSALLGVAAATGSNAHAQGVTAAPAAAPAASRTMTERYTRAEQLLPWNAGRLVFGDVVAPQWYKDGTRFWFRNKTKNGADFLFVDPTLKAEAEKESRIRPAPALAPVQKK